MNLNGDAFTHACPSKMERAQHIMLSQNSHLFPGASISEEIKAGLIRVVDNPTSIGGILLHGSRAVGTADQMSDFDILCLFKKNQQGHHREIVPFGNVSADIYYCAPRTVNRRLQMRVPNNNSFYLTALSCGKILLDRTGELTALVKTAFEKRRTRPPQISADELILTRQQLKSALTSIERCIARAHESPELSGLTRVRCAEVFSRILYAYCVEHRVWTSTLPAVLHWTKENCSELYRCAHDYLVAPSLAASVDSLYRLLDFLTVTGE